MSIYETHQMNDPRLPFIFHSRQSLRPHALSYQANWHENVEILSVQAGSGRILCDNEHFLVSVGNTVVVNTNCLHKIEALDEGMVCHCLIVDRGFCMANHFDTNAIRFEECFADAEIDRLMQKLEEAYATPTDHAYRIPLIRSLVLSIMAQLCCRHTLPNAIQKPEQRLMSCIKQSIGLIRSDASRDLPLDEVAAFVGLSKYYFAREFRRITGYTFVSYVNLTRCEMAKVLLAQNDLSIGEVGRACGFSNQSYFTKTFRAYTGRLPGVYRETHQQKKP